MDFCKTSLIGAKLENYPLRSIFKWLLDNINRTGPVIFGNFQKNAEDSHL